MKKRIVFFFLLLAVLACALPMAALAETCNGTGCTHVAAIGSEHYSYIGIALASQIFYNQ